jgi:hypothetical protein
VGNQRLDFAEFYRESKDECLFTVLVSVGDRDTAQELVAEAFARLGIVARGQQASGTKGVGGSHRAEREHFPVAASPP